MSVTAASAFGGSYETMAQAPATDTTPAQVRLTFVGTGVKIYATKTAVSGKARIYIDGVDAVYPKMIFDPPWSPEMMTEDAKFALGF